MKTFWRKIIENPTRISNAVFLAELGIHKKKNIIIKKNNNKTNKKTLKIISFFFGLCWLSRPRRVMRCPGKSPCPGIWSATRRSICPRTKPSTGTGPCLVASPRGSATCYPLTAGACRTSARRPCAA